MATSQDDVIPLSEHNRLLLAVHNAMRADGNRLVAAIADLDRSDARSATALGRAFGAIIELIHDHHWTEDDAMYPFLVERVDGFEIHLVELEEDHINLDASMARIAARFRLLGHTLNDTLQAETHRHLVDEANSFRDYLTSHLQREEAIVFGLVDAFSEPEQSALHRQESKLATYRHIRMAVPWVLANATPDEETELRAQAPRLLGAIADHVWDKSFQKIVEPLYRY
jgi:hemerythrin-like domain-containing protein